MLRALALLTVLGSSGCDILFELQTVPTAAADAEADATADGSNDGLVARFPMESVAGTFAACMKDVIGHHDGTCVGGMPTIVTGAIGSGYKFDGVTGIQIADAADLDSPEATIAYWQNLATLPSTTGNFECPVNRVFGNAGDDTWQVCPAPAGTFFKVGGTSTMTSTMVQVGAWHHVAITYDATSFVVWLDGAAIGNGQSTVKLDPAEPIVLGYDLNGDGLGNFTPSATYDGVLDDLRFYDRALSRDELLALAAHR